MSALNVFFVHIYLLSVQLCAGWAPVHPKPGLTGLYRLIIFICDLCYNCSYVLVGLAGLLVLLNLGLGGLYKLILLAVLSGTVLYMSFAFNMSDALFWCNLNHYFSCIVSFDPELFGWWRRILSSD
jgi:hypothetical protein